MKKRILDLMNSAGYQPMNKSELARALELEPQQRSEMRQVLVRLERQGKLMFGKKGRMSLRRKKSRGLVGTMKFLKRGGALFFPDANDATNLDSGIDLEKYAKVFIPSKGCSTALDGDTVVVELDRPKDDQPHWKKHVKDHRGKKGGKFDKSKAKTKGKGKGKDRGRDRDRGRRDDDSGKVVTILKRKTDSFLGLYFKRGKNAFIQPEDALLPDRMDVINVINVVDGVDAKSGQLVIVKLLKWDNFFDTPKCEIIEVVGWPEEPGVDIISVIKKHRLRQEFPQEVVDEALKAHESGVPESEIARREDWREKFVITIDPYDAKDFDDAIAVEKLADGGWRLAVHIADVSHYVPEYSELDKEAQLRGNSTYLVDRVLPMLPEELSNDICSLRPHVDRLTKCAIIDISADGQVGKYRLVDAVIHSKHRLTYEEAQEMLDSDKSGELEEYVRECWKMSSTLRKRRFQKGSLDLDFPEVKVVLDEKFVPIRVDRVVHNESHKLIEECMLAANEVVALELKRKRANSVYRIHENPDFDKLAEYTELVRSHGFEPGDLSNKDHIQKLIKEIKGHPSEQAIKIGLLKSLKRAAYSVEGLGHYGLGKMDYCHFTSPIRRYADLIVHRGLQSLIQNKPAKPARVPKLTILAEVASHISETERTSAAAENESKKMKLMEYLCRVQESGEDITFDGVITECRRMGPFVEILDVQQRALVHLKDFPRGDWRYEEGMHRYIASGGRQISLGQKVTLRLKMVDLAQQMIDCSIVDF